MQAQQELALRDEADKLELARAMLERARPRVRYADLLVEEVTKVEYTRLVGGDEVVKPFSRKGAVQLRLVGEEGRHLSVSFGLLPEAELLPGIDYALEALALQEPDPRYGLAPVPNAERVRYGVASPGDLSSEDVLLAFDTLAREVDQVCTRVADGGTVEVRTELWCYAQVEEKLVLDTEGLFKTQVLPSTFLQMTAIARDPSTGKTTRQRTRLGDTQPLGFFFADGHPAHGLRRDFVEGLSDCTRRAVAQQKGRRLSGAELSALTHYVLAPTAMVFVHEAEGHNFEADLIQQGTSGLFHKDGCPADDPFASALVDVWDGQILKADGGFDETAGFGTHFIDDEGVELKPVRLVQGGRITGKLHNRETAHHFGEKPNGHGFSELGDKRLVRMTNTYLLPAGQEGWCSSLEDLIGDVTFGVFLEGSLGGAVSRDGMSTTIQFGRVIRDGRLTDEVLLPANLSVVTRDSLKSVEGFAGPLRLDGVGFCGKGQTKTVTEGGPVTKLRATPAITLGF